MADEDLPAAPGPTAASPAASPAEVELARAALRDGAFEALPEPERRRLGRVLSRMHLARDTAREFDRASGFGERMADRIASFGGSWTFIGLFGAFMLTWAVLNTEILGPRRAAFDPYPYVFLNLMLSMLAALQAPVIMMSQNRQSARDRLEARNDYEVNLKAELEIRALHERLDALQRELAAMHATLGRDRRDADAR